MECFIYQICKFGNVKHISEWFFCEGSTEFIKSSIARNGDCKRVLDEFGVILTAIRFFGAYFKHREY